MPKNTQCRVGAGGQDAFDLGQKFLENAYSVCDSASFNTILVGSVKLSGQTFDMVENHHKSSPQYGLDSMAAQQSTGVGFAHLA